MKLCIAMRRKEWFKGLWSKTKSFSLPVSFPFKTLMIILGLKDLV